MIEALIAYLGQRMTLTPEHVALVRSVAHPRTVARGEHLQRAGEVAEHAIFVARGCLRGYVIDAEGKEHILHFAAEDFWLGDFESARTRTPSALFVEAIEPSEVLLITANGHNLLLERIPGFAAAFATGLQRRAAARDRWILGAMSARAKQRYEEFLAAYPSIASRVPQHMIASYLGLTPETLSRVRRQMARKRKVRGEPPG